MDHPHDHGADGHRHEGEGHRHAAGPASGVDDLVEVCRSHGLRRTHALHVLLDLFLRAGSPLNLRTITAQVTERMVCNPATLYRLVMRLEEHGVIRRLGLHERSAHYFLPDAGGHRDWIVCVDCGDVAPLDVPCPVHAIEDEVRRKTGFAGLYHELQFYGHCPRCLAGAGS